LINWFVDWLNAYCWASRGAIKAVGEEMKIRNIKQYCHTDFSCNNVSIFNIRQSWAKEEKMETFMAVWACRLLNLAL
jgi:hypothetical protein